MDPFILSTILKFVIIALVAPNLNADNHVEVLEWWDAEKLIVRVGNEFQVVDFETNLQHNWTLFNNETISLNGKFKAIKAIQNTHYIQIIYSSNATYQKNEILRIYDTKTGEFDIVGPKRTGNENIDAFAFSPSGNGYIFVFDYNLYFRPTVGADELIQLTFDGHTDFRHGITSWAYSEALFGPKAFWWASDGEELVYMTTNLTDISTYNISWYGDKPYPEQQVQRYAKTGVRNLEKIHLHVWQKSTGQTVDLIIELPERQRVYLMHGSYVKLHGQNVFIAVFANRFQDEITYAMCTLKSEKCISSYYHSFKIDDLHQYSHADQVKVGAYDGHDSFFAILPNKRLNGDVFDQIARITVEPNFHHAQSQFLAMGDQVVEKIHKYDPETDKIYFTSPAPIHRQLHLYSTSANPQNDMFSAQCVTCNVFANCTYHESTFAPDSNKFFMNCKGIGPTVVYVAQINSSGGVELLANFDQIIGKDKELFDKKIPRLHFENITLANGFVSFVRMLLPHEVNLNTTTKKYPVLVYAYGSPNSHSVHEEWLPEFPIDAYFSYNLKYIIINIDGRGTGNAGWRRRQPLYGNLGTVEIEDQIETTRLLLEKHTFLDKDKVGIWGWSYGGFATAHVVSKDDKHIFKCAAIIAPVIYFKMYDAIYTERYMGNASEHAYDLTDAAKNVTNFRYTRTLLVHGTGDGNVHFQNSIHLIKALVSERIQFDLMIYPNEKHSLVNVKPHVFDKIVIFFRNCMNKD